jgi:Na+/glutamate symporter
MNYETQGWRRFGPGLAVAVVAAVLAVGLFGVPLGSVLFVGLLLLCPLMMMGMHGGHGAPRGSDSATDDHGLTNPRSSPPGSDSDAGHMS